MKEELKDSDVISTSVADSKHNVDSTKIESTLPNDNATMPKSQKKVTTTDKALHATKNKSQTKIENKSDSKDSVEKDANIKNKTNSAQKDSSPKISDYEHIDTPISKSDINSNTKWHDALNKSPSNENTLAVLNSVYNNVTMGFDCVTAIIPYAKNEKFADVLRSQGEKYNEFLNRAKTLADDMGCEIDSSLKLNKTMAKASIKVKLLLNSSTSKIAEMMIQGTTMGVIDMGKLLRHTPDVMAKTLDLAREVMEFEENKIEILKHHL
ncbi:MAG: hypothetical protein RR307_05995 [Clostridia bacterium]